MMLQAGNFMSLLAYVAISVIAGIAIVAAGYYKEHNLYRLRQLHRRCRTLPDIRIYEDHEQRFPVGNTCREPCRVPLYRTSLGILQQEL